MDAQGVISDRWQVQAEYQVEDLGDGVILEMVVLPGGQFQMGSPEGEGYDDERPQAYFVTKRLLSCRAQSCCQDRKAASIALW